MPLSKFGRWHHCRVILHHLRARRVWWISVLTTDIVRRSFLHGWLVQCSGWNLEGGAAGTGLSSLTDLCPVLRWRWSKDWRVGLEGCLTMPGLKAVKLPCWKAVWLCSLKAARLLDWRAVWFMPGLKADCVPGWIVVQLPSGLKADRLPGWKTVWLPPGPEGCKVEPSLGGGSLGIGGLDLAQVVSVWALWVKNPECQWYAALQKLHGTVYEERRPNQAAKNSVKPFTYPPSHLHLPCNTQTHRLVEPSSIAQHLLVQTSPTPGRCKGSDLMWP